jgi:hypothetical protein
MGESGAWERSWLPEASVEIGPQGVTGHAKIAQHLLGLVQDLAAQRRSVPDAARPKQWTWHAEPFKAGAQQVSVGQVLSGAGSQPHDRHGCPDHRLVPPRASMRGLQMSFNMRASSSVATLRERWWRAPQRARLRLGVDPGSGAWVTLHPNNLWNSPLWPVTRAAPAGSGRRARHRRQVGAPRRPDARRVRMSPSAAPRRWRGRRRPTWASPRPTSLSR